MRRRGCVSGRSTGRDDGSMLIEALVGIGMLGAIIGAVATIQASVLASERSSGDRVRALSEAEWTLAHHAAGLTSMDAPASTQSFLLPLGHDGCDAAGQGGIDGVTVQAATQHTGEEVRLVRAAAVEGPFLGAGSVDSSALVSIHPGHPGPVGMALAPRGPVSPDVIVQVGPCFASGPLDPGLHELRVVEDEIVLIDALHRSASEAPLQIAVLDRPIRSTWDVSVPAWLSVGMLTSGARAPDGVHPGSLRWLLRGDDARAVTELGSARAVHPGAVTAVVSACENAEAHASSVALMIGPGESRHVDVPMAVVTVTNVAERNDATLVLFRSTGCHDGSGLRPELRWIGGLVEGMRIALPHGYWEGQLETASGARLTGVVGFPAGEPGVIVVLP